MRRPSRPGLTLVLALCVCLPLSAQDLASFAKERPFTFSGGVSLNQVFYYSSGASARRDPYSYVASGNLNLSLYGWSIPLRFTFSNNRATFSQPFNQYALHPTWKWITVHAGYTSASYSPYTVNGHIFLGAAVDLEPEGKWTISALYGRFLKAVPYNADMNAAHLPSYQRVGYGTKIRYGNSGNFAELIAFGATDDLVSAPGIPDSTGILPEQNLVISVGVGKVILKHLTLKTEMAASAITRDRRAEGTRHDHLMARLPGFRPTLASSYYNAMKTSLDYRKEGWLLGIAHERIDPGYRTLGAYYFNNDLESVTLNGAAGMFSGKLNVTASTGMQRDNLDDTKLSTMRRMVGSVNMAYMPSQKANFSGSWSTFQTFTNIRSQFETINQVSPYDYLDTLNFTQISQNATLTGMYALAVSESQRQHINVQATWQQAAEKQGNMNPNGGTQFYSVNASYGMSLIPQNLSVAVSLNATVNRGPFLETSIIGPTASLSRTFLGRKIRTSASASYNETRSDNARLNAVFNIRCNGVLVVREKHNLTITSILVNRTSYGEGSGRTLREFTATVGYSYAFGGGFGSRRRTNSRVNNQNK